MKRYIYWYLFLCGLVLTSVSCQKDPTPTPNSGLMIIHAIQGVGPLMMNSKVQEYTGGYGTGVYIKYRNFDPYTRLVIPAEEYPMMFYTIPRKDNNDKPLFEMLFSPKVSSSATLFLLGTASERDTYTLETIPPYYAAKDSLMGLRFVNVSADKKPIRIKVSGLADNNALQSIAYKSATTYLSIDARASVQDVNIEVFDAQTGVLLTKYTLPNVGDTQVDINKWRYKSYTFVWLPQNASGTVDNEPLLIQDY